MQTSKTDRILAGIPSRWLAECEPQLPYVGPLIHVLVGLPYRGIVRHLDPVVDRARIESVGRKVRP